LLIVPAVSFAHPLFFLALLAIPIALWLRRRQPSQALVIPHAADWYRPAITSANHWPATLASLAAALLITALARPQKHDDRHETTVEGYDILLAIDLSGSMLAEDYERAGQRINRLQAVKPIIQAFIEQRTTDRIGVVLFAGRAFTLAPLTFDHPWLARQIERLKIGLIEDGTAIGDGLGLALTRLEQEQRNDPDNHRKGAFVILLTDGANNRGTLSPVQAAEIAAKRNIPVYAIAAGGDRPARAHIRNENGQIVDSFMVAPALEPALQEIADLTHGQFYRATASRTIRDAFASIDRAQKIEFQAKTHRLTTELYPYPLAAALLLLLPLAAGKIRI
jgi:Ca-activated chloride channel family protein